MSAARSEGGEGGESDCACSTEDCRQVSGVDDAVVVDVAEVGDIEHAEPVDRRVVHSEVVQVNPPVVVSVELRLQQRCKVHCVDDSITVLVHALQETVAQAWRQITGVKAAIIGPVEPRERR